MKIEPQTSENLQNIDVWRVWPNVLSVRKSAVFDTAFKKTGPDQFGLKNCSFEQNSIASMD